MNHFIQCVSVFDSTRATSRGQASRTRYIGSRDGESAVVVWASLEDLEKLPKMTRSARPGDSSIERLEKWSRRKNCVALEIANHNRGMRVRALARHTSGAGVWEVSSAGAFTQVELPTKKWKVLEIGSRLVVPPDDLSQEKLEQFFSLIDGFDRSLRVELLDAICRPDLETRLLHHEIRLSALESSAPQMHQQAPKGFLSSWTTRVHDLPLKRIAIGVGLCVAALAFGAGGWWFYQTQVAQTSEPQEEVATLDLANTEEDLTPAVEAVSRLVDRLIAMLAEADEASPLSEAKPFLNRWSKTEEIGEDCLTRPPPIAPGEKDGDVGMEPWTIQNYMNCRLSPRVADDDAEAPSGDGSEDGGTSAKEDPPPDCGEQGVDEHVPQATRCFLIALCRAPAPKATSEEDCIFPEGGEARWSIKREAELPALDLLACSLATVMEPGGPPCAQQIDIGKLEGVVRELEKSLYDATSEEG